MAIDILDLNETDLLPTLGDGDWLIALPDNYPDVIIPAVWRRQLSDSGAIKWVRWVINGIFVEINHDLDPPWDHSGQAYRYRADPQMLLARYETLQEWMDEECTGNSTASFVSGMGLFWDTYGKDVESDVDEKVSELLKAHFRSMTGYDEDDDIWIDMFDDVTWVQSAITHAIVLTIGLRSTQEAWATLQTEVQIQMAEERREAEERAAHYAVMHEQIQQFWQRHFAHLDNRRIERPEFRALKLADRLRDLLADTDPQLVHAISELSLPGDFSNSVRTEIQRIARRVLVD